MPYRVVPTVDSPRAPERERDRALFVVGLALWAASVARVAFAIARGETFGAIATLALGVAIILPVTALRSLLRRSRSSRA